MQVTMNRPKIIITMMYASLVVITSPTEATSADQNLHLNSYSEDKVEGCYIYNQTLGVCFDISKGFMKLLKTTGEQIVLYKELGTKIFFYQVLDQAFIGWNASMVYVPTDVPRNPDELRAFLSGISENGMTEHEALKNHYQEAMSELHYVPEVLLLERVSAALGDNSTRLEILQPFYSLCFNLLKASDVETPSELKAAHALEDETTERKSDRQKRGCTTPTENQCTGLCGKGCWCWQWFCGDCCWHQGCYEHDMCCEKKPYSSFCLTPVGLTCSGFSDYARCMESSLPSWLG